MFKSARKNRRAFTLVELLVVIAIIALLISILLPSLARAREQAKKTKCFGNLKDIGSASVAYAMDDPNEELVPRHSGASYRGHENQAQYLGGALNEYIWGGKGGRPSYWGDGPLDNVRYFTQWNGPRTPNGPGGRLLNKTLYPSVADAEDEDIEAAIARDNGLDLAIYHCPSDAGMSSSRDGRELIQNFTGGGLMFGVLEEDAPFYDAMGNSYKAHFLMTGFGSNPPGVPSAPRYGYSAAQRPYTQIPSASRTVVFSEGNALWTHIWNDHGQSGWGPAPTQWGTGWHGEKMVFVASFADGHAGVMDQNVRMRPPIGLAGAGYQYGDTWYISGSRPEYIVAPHNNAYYLWDLIYRGEGWQLDTFPAPIVPVDFE